MQPRVLVVGATGWTGTEVVAKLQARGTQVTVLSRAPKQIDGTGVSTVVGDLANDAWVSSIPPQDAIISCFGLRDWELSDAEVYNLVKGGLERLYDAAVRSGAKQLVIMSALKPCDARGRPYTGNVVKRAREEGLQAIMARSRKERAGGSGGPAPAVTVIEPNMLFKDVEGMYSRLAKSGRMMLLGNALDLRVNPISASDVASRLCDALLNEAEYDRHLTVGGPDVVTFRQMAQRMAAVSGRGADVKLKAVPLAVAVVMLALMDFLAWLSGWPKLLRVVRFGTSILNICRHAGPEGLLGTPYGKDHVMDFIDMLPNKLGTRHSAASGAGNVAVGKPVAGAAAAKQD